MNLHYLYTPVIFAAIGSYIIARYYSLSVFHKTIHNTSICFSCFFSVYTVAVDTLFLCLLEDLERNDGSQSKPYFMSKKLRTLVVKQSNSSRHGQVFTVSEAFTQWNCNWSINISYNFYFYLFVFYTWRTSCQIKK